MSERVKIASENLSKGLQASGQGKPWQDWVKNKHNVNRLVTANKRDRGAHHLLVAGDRTNGIGFGLGRDLETDAFPKRAPTSHPSRDQSQSMTQKEQKWFPKPLNASLRQTATIDCP
jgi:hypothetical protein